MLSRANRPNIGPYSLLLHMPEMAQRLEALRTYIRDIVDNIREKHALANLDPEEPTVVDFTRDDEEFGAAIFLTRAMISALADGRPTGRLPESSHPG